MRFYLVPDLFEHTLMLAVGALVLGGAAVAVTTSRELRVRWLVWLAALGIGVGAVLLPYGFRALTVVLGVSAAEELTRLLAPARRAAPAGAGAGLIAVPDALHSLGPGTARIAVLAGCLVPVLTIPASVANANLPLLALALLALILPAIIQRRGSGRGAVALILTSAAYVGIPLGILATLPPDWAFALLTVVAVVDVAGYLFGRTLGRQGGLARSISVWSPNKTRGGLLGSLVVGALGFALLGLLPLAVLVPAAAVLGDLRESRLKRRAGVKDAGSWLPGFGGLLDRIDSMLGAAIGVALTGSVTSGLAFVLLGGRP